MTIVHIITRLIIGGAQQNTIMCCTAQAAAGHTVWLMYGPIYGPEGSLLPLAQSSKAQLVEVQSMRRAILPFHDLICYRALRHWIQRIKPEVVHTHSSKAGILGRAAAWAEGVPAILHTVHGLPFHQRQPRLIYATYVAAERWAARRCHKLIGVTQAMCDAFQQHRIGTPDRFKVVPSGIDIADFQLPPTMRNQVRQELGIAPDTFVVGLVARLDKLKGQEDLIDILPALKQRLQNVCLLLVGGGWYRKHLETKVNQARLQGDVIFTGLVSPKRVAELLTAMDINTLPSYQEGQPRTLIQALLSGCAIVGYAVGGIPEICIDGVTGRLVPLGNRPALFEAISWLLEHSEERQRLIQQGQHHARQNFDHRIMIQRLEQVYARTLRHSTTTPNVHSHEKSCLF